MSGEAFLNKSNWLLIESDTAGSVVPARLAPAVKDLQSWIEEYVTAHLHDMASIEEFRIRLRERLIKAHEQSPNEQHVHVLIEKTVRNLVHDQNRTEVRRYHKFFDRLESHEVPDPRNHIEAELLAEEATRLSQSAAKAALEAMTAEDRSLVEQLYGLHNVSAVSREEMARRLGIRRNTLDQRLRRLFISVRKAFGT